MLFVVSPPSFVSFAVCPDKGALAFLHIVQELTLVGVTVGPLIVSFSMSFSILELTLVAVLIPEGEHSVAIVLSLDEVSLVGVACGVDLQSLSFDHPLFPLTDVVVSFCPNVASIASSEVFIIESLVDAAISFNFSAPTGSESIPVLALVGGAVWVHVGAEVR